MELLIDKLVRRVSNETQWENVRAELEMQHKVNKFDNIALDIVFARSKAGLLARDDEESVPLGYCDDLLDYWPDIQHPVGYHPTTSCSAKNTHTRGFSSWMSCSEDGTHLIDPLRMRNMSQSSQMFGSAHLVCDAFAYAAPGHSLNPFYMASKWKPESKADAAVPIRAPKVTMDEMLYKGKPSMNARDTTFRGEGRSRSLGWRIHESVEDTKLSTNKQHTLSRHGSIKCFT